MHKAPIELNPTEHVCMSEILSLKLVTNLQLGWTIQLVAESSVASGGRCFSAALEAQMTWWTFELTQV